MQESFPSSVCLSLALTNTHAAHKDCLYTFMQGAQRTARERGKSHNAKQKQREVNE